MLAINPAIVAGVAWPPVTHRAGLCGVQVFGRAWAAWGAPATVPTMVVFLVVGVGIMLTLF